jgi:hypothetical protein
MSPLLRARLRLERLEDRTLLSGSVTLMADLNGDGAPDLIMVDFANKLVIVRLAHGPANNPFAPPQYYSIGTEPDALTVTDVNSDGKLDLVVTNATDTEASVLLGKGGGAFEAAYTTSVGSVLTVSQLGLSRFVVPPPPPPGAILITAAGRGTGLPTPPLLLDRPPAPMVPVRESGQGGPPVPNENRTSATASAQGSGVDSIVPPGDDRLSGTLLGPSTPLFIGVGNDLVSGIDLAGSLLTGGRCVPNLVARKGTSLAPVATVGDSAEEPPSTATLAAQETSWIDFVIGLDDTVLPRYPTLVVRGPQSETVPELGPIDQAPLDEELPTSAEQDAGTGEAGPSRAGVRGGRCLALELGLALVAMLLASGLYEFSIPRIDSASSPPRG